MKILHVVHGYPPSLGGSQILVQQLSENLQRRYGDQVTVFTTVARQMEQFQRGGTPMLSAGIEVINGVTVRRFPLFNRLSWLRMALAGLAYRLRLPFNDQLRTLHNGPIIPGLTQAIAGSEADVIFATAFPLQHMYNAQAGAQQAKKPLVFLGALHTSDVWGYDRPMIYRAIRAADAYIAHTDFERNYLIERGVDRDTISVIGGGVELEPLLKADGQAARGRYHLADGPVVLTLGKQTARKRFHILIEAMQRVWPTHPHAQLVIAGACGSASPQIKARIEALPLDRRAQVKLISDFSEAEKPSLLAACDLFVLASGQESFGIAFVEAWGCAKPVIGARVGAMSSLISEGRDGLLFDYDQPDSLAEAICRLIEDQSMQARFGTAGQQKVLQHYTWDIVTDRVRQVYQQAIARHQTAGKH